MDGDVVDRDDHDQAVESGDYYYLKALKYLEASKEDSCDDDHCSCQRCHSPRDKCEDNHHFSLTFSPGLTFDDHHGYSASGGTDSATHRSTSPSTSSEDFRETKNGRGNVRHNLGNSNSRVKIRVKRRTSDGHVHWADEFRKDLTRCHPRKSYSRHPSHTVPHVKSILKQNCDDDTHS